MRVGGGAKNRKMRLPAQDADKHTCAELYALTCRHTRGLKRPKWPSKGWRFRFDYNSTYFREEWMERGKHWMWFYSSEPEQKHWSLYWALITGLSDTVSRYIFCTLWGRKNKSKGRESCTGITCASNIWERENLTENPGWTTTDVRADHARVHGGFQASRKRAETQQLLY